MVASRRMATIALCIGTLLIVTLALSGCASDRTTITPTTRPILTPLPSIIGQPNTVAPECRPLGLGTASTIPFPGRVGLIWYAEQIVTGTVVAQETRWDYPTGEAIITTYSLFRVDERVRGLPAAEVLIAQSGGTLDGCKQQNSEQPLARDRRLLLFLRHYDTGINEPAYSIMFGGNGLYTVAETITGTPTTQALDEIRQILSQPPPANLSPAWIIPLDRAPLTAPLTATPAH